ncbi:MAG TPA: 3'(2'),5'-bisphosphate nucleotidase [Gammaproteobacteria bacterium]|nr:3'(2'),5'-bisphosphate nucleotidase [Gammaproteobacteria bacterium]
MTRQSISSPKEAPVANPSELLNDIIDLAADAGERILEVYQTDFDITQKEDDSPLTAADMAAHNAIVAGLSILTPELPILSEESAKIPFEERKQWQTYWLVDPLDGTREFIKRNGEFTVNIALIDRHESILGVIYAPVSGLTYYAARGHGAYKRIKDGEATRIHTRKKEPGRTTVAGSRSHRGDSLKAFLAHIGEHDIVSMGSSLKSGLVAEGKADIYPRLGPTSEWDTAAAHCIVDEAGGRITKTDLSPLRYNTKESLLNPEFLAVGDPDYDWVRFL